MDLADIPSIIDKCEEIVADTGKLNKILHRADFVEQKMTLLKSVFGASDSPALVLNQLASLLRVDPAIRQILKDECGKLDEEAFYPHFLFYCSIVVYVEYIQINKKNVKGETK